MSWIILALIKSAADYGAKPILQKKIAGQDNRPKRFALTFGFNFLLATGGALLLGQLRLTPLSGMVMIATIVNVGGAFLHWKAVDVSLSKTSLFTFLDDIVAMTLSIVVLGEVRFLNGPIIAGIVMSFLALWLFAASDFRRKVTCEEAKRQSLEYWLCVLGYSLIWGVVIFLQRWWATKAMPLGSFLFAWYGGSLLGALLIWLIASRRGMEKINKPFTRREVGLTAAYSLALTTNIGITYLIYRMAPLVVVQPIFLVAEMVIPTVFGLWLFKEHKRLSPAEWSYLALAVTGGITIALGYR